jgi:hypothetical protein
VTVLKLTEGLGLTEAGIEEGEYLFETTKKQQQGAAKIRHGIMIKLACYM